MSDYNTCNYAMPENPLTCMSKHSYHENYITTRSLKVVRWNYYNNC